MKNLMRWKISLTLILSIYYLEWCRFGMVGLRHYNPVYNCWSTFINFRPEIFGFETDYGPYCMVDKLNGIFNTIWTIWYGPYDMNHGMIHTFLTMKYIIWSIVWSTYYDRISWSAVCLNWSMFVRRSIENYKNDRCWVEVTSALVLVSILSVELNS